MTPNKRMIKLVGVLNVFALIVMFVANAYAAKKEQCVDLSIGGVVFGNAESFKRAYGHLRLNWRGSAPYGLLCLQDVNSDIVLYFIHHPGDEQGSFLEAEIANTNERNLLTSKNRPGHFLGNYSCDLKGLKSYKGICLGMKESEVVKILGRAMKREKGHGVVRLLYKSKTKQVRGKLARELEMINMPIYYGEYDFIDGRLVRFMFGFEPV
jgi:hypothetical protein